jgi:hypothetical protein
MPARSSNLRQFAGVPLACFLPFPRHELRLRTHPQRMDALEISVRFSTVVSLQNSSTNSPGSISRRTRPRAGERVRLPLDLNSRPAVDCACYTNARRIGFARRRKKLRRARPPQGSSRKRLPGSCHSPLTTPGTTTRDSPRATPSTLEIRLRESISRVPLGRRPSLGHAPYFVRFCSGGRYTGVHAGPPSVPHARQAQRRLRLPPTGEPPRSFSGDRDALRLRSGPLRIPR